VQSGLNHLIPYEWEQLIGWMTEATFAGIIEGLKELDPD